MVPSEGPREAAPVELVHQKRQAERWPRSAALWPRGRCTSHLCQPACLPRQGLEQAMRHSAPQGVARKSLPGHGSHHARSGPPVAAAVAVAVAAAEVHSAGHRTEAAEAPSAGHLGAAQALLAGHRTEAAGALSAGHLVAVPALLAGRHAEVAEVLVMGHRASLRRRHLGSEPPRPPVKGLAQEEEPKKHPRWPRR